MRHPSPPCPIRLPLGIDVQDNLRNLLPIRTIVIGVDKPKISNQVLLIVDREHFRHRCYVRDVWIKWRPFHDISPISRRWMRATLAATIQALKSRVSHREMLHEHHSVPSTD
jgi:hypothetical protein